MIGIQKITIDGKVFFYPYQCEYCQLDTAGNHSYNCPNRSIPNLIYDPNRDIPNLVYDPKPKT